MSSKGLRRTVAASLAVGLLIAPTPAMATESSYNVSNQLLSFFAPGDGDAEVFQGANTNTAPFRYQNLITISGTSIDAIVTVVELSNSYYKVDDDNSTPNTLDRLDKTNVLDSEDQAKELESSFRNSADEDNIEGYAVVDIQFVAGGTSNPVRLSNVALSVADIDNNQFVQFSGLSSYKLSPSLDVLDMLDEDNPAPATVGSQVSALTGSATITTSDAEPIDLTIPDGSVRFFASEDSDRYDDGDEDQSADLFVAQAMFGEVSTIRIKFGSFETGSASLDFLFETYGNFSSVSAVTVTQPAFIVSYDVNTGTGTPPTSSSGTGALTVAGSLTTPGITKSGFTFAGWNTRADGLGVTYAPGSTILPVANTTLYAVWSAQSTPTPAAALATTGANLEWLMVAGFLAVIAGSGFLAFSRRKRIW